MFSNLFKPRSSVAFHKGGYAVITNEGRYRDGFYKLILRIYQNDGRYVAAFFGRSGTAWRQELIHPSKDFRGSGLPLPEGYYKVDKPIRQAWAEPGVGHIKIPLDQVSDAPNNRSELLIHDDFNRETAPGSIGCWVTEVSSDMPRIANLFEQHKVDLCIVDYGLGYVDRKDAPLVSTGGKDLKCFEWIYRFTAEFEGGYVNHPADPGGRTNFGITQAFLDANYPGTDVLDLTPSKAKGIYFEHFYRQWTGRSWYLNGVMFDTAVNFGLRGSREFLQEALGFTGDAVDGRVGPITLGKLDATKDHDELAREIVKGRIAYRHLRVAQNKTQSVFLKGWLRRDNALLHKVRKR